MNTPLKIIISLFVVSISFTSCRDNYIPEEFFLYPGLELNDTTWNNSVTPIVKTDSLIKHFAMPASTKTFSANSGGTFEIAGKTKVSLPPSVYLQFPSLTPVAGTSTITAEFTPMYKKGDFIRNLRSTVAQTGICETDAMFNLKLSNAAGTVILSSGNTYEIQYIQPAATSSNYTFFYETINGGNLNNPVVWQEGIASDGICSYTPSVVITGTIPSAGYKVKSNKTSFIAVNKPYLPAATARANVVLPVNFTNKNTVVFAVFTNKNIILRLTPDAVNRNFFYDKMPEGESVNFVCVSYIDDKYYWGNEKYITNKSITKYKLNPRLNPVSVSEIINALNNL